MKLPRLDWRTITTSVVIGLALSGLGWVGVSINDSVAFQVKQQEVNKSFEVENQDKAEAIRALKEEIAALRKEAASKQDIAELKKLTEKLLDLQLRGK